jgi:hypothetical protein
VLYGVKKRGDQSVVPALRRRPSDRKIDNIEQQVVKVTSAPVVRRAGSDTGVGIPGERTRPRGQQEDSAAVDDPWQVVPRTEEKVKPVHAWRLRRSRFGELVQWDTSEPDRPEGRGEKLYLIATIDAAASRLFARFVRHDSTEEKRRLRSTMSLRWTSMKSPALSW